MPLMDFVILPGLVTIIMCMTQTVISSRIAATDKDFSRRFDKLSFSLIAFLYLGLNIALPLVARIHQACIRITSAIKVFILRYNLSCQTTSPFPQELPK